MRISVSEKHGVNPSVLICPVCGTDMGLALLGRLPGDAEAPRKIINAEGPCEACEKKIEGAKEAAFIFLVVDDLYQEVKSENRRHPPTPWQFFLGYYGIKKDAEFLKGVDTSHEIIWISKSDAEHIGLPIKEASQKEKS